MTRDELARRIDAIEEAYEFFLAYAAQGLAGDAGTQISGQLRAFLERTDEALDGLADGFAAIVEGGDLEPIQAHRDLAAVLERDADSALAAVRAVRGMDSISSQLIDNLNAYSHLRALLTDLFLIDELLGDAADAGPRSDRGEE